MSKIEVKYVELGFRFLNKDKLRGETAFTSENFLKTLKIPQSLKIGVMINAGDFLKGNLNLVRTCQKIFPNLKKSKISFVRLACHIQEVYKIIPIIKWLKNQNVTVFINIMQISELKDKEILKVSKFLSNKKFDILYFADSLGCMKPKDIEKVYKLINKYWKGQIGIHAHDNLNFALKNTLKAKSCGIEWLDSTILGMGRGPGNTKTEELLKYIFNFKKKNRDIYNLIKRYFNPLKKKYNWGTNKYYRYAAKNKIHPTYIQEILSDKRYNSKEYKNILNNLKETDSRKFNPFKLIVPKNIYVGKPRGKWRPFSEIEGRDILIIRSRKNC
jgi:4-hydroxy 2-oxovalerate aldolase